ncbi:hypothetical protein [Promicromonospora iranensis]|uniref:Uncharacterized protein n=1 Tax=Promicromonospora iranensis TaxID=1105144 RepID=A0ABU2CTD5_9MICO|nr:hypothetical protein [Promicromonospora iranensis]MDR7384608.1 hypothetical protein [Promicromonospora iranensis]
MFGFTDHAEYRRNEQEIDRRAEQSRVAREQKDTARRQAAERRSTERATQRAGRTTSTSATRPRVA